MYWWLSSAQHTCDRRLSDPGLQYVVLMQISLLAFLPHLSETIAKYSNRVLHVSNLKFRYGHD